MSDDAPRGGGLARLLGAAPEVGPGRCVVLATGAGLLTGYVEVAHLAARRRFLHEILPGPDETVWVLPALYGLLFAALGLVLALPLRPWRRLVTLPVAVFVLVAVAVWSQFLLQLSPPIAPLAVLVLSVGIAAVAARLATRYAAAVLRLSAWATPALAVLTAVVALALPGVQGLGEQRRLAALPAAASGAPNVLLVVLDTVRADHLRPYGYARDTAPHLDRLAAAGVVLERVIATSSWTVPTHATMFTGLFSHEQKEEGWIGVLDHRHPTLAEAFSEHGYATAGFVGNVNYCCSDRGFDRGFARYEDFQLNPVMAVMSTGLGRWLFGAQFEGHLVQYMRNSAGTVTTRFLDWLAAQEEDRPFFAFLNYFDAHALYLPPPPFDTRFGPRSEHLESWRSRQREWTDEQMQGFVRAYDGCIAYIDEQLEKVVEHLHATGRLENTVLVVTSDHGEHFGEHELMSHANSLYRAALHVPLVLHFPARIRAPARVGEIVSLRDVAATIADLAGLRPARPFPGFSLAPLWEGAADGAPPEVSPALARVAPAGGPAGKPSWWPIAKGTVRSLTAGGMHYILNGDGSEELYDFESDPEERRNLVDTDEGRRALPDLRRRLPR